MFNGRFLAEEPPEFKDFDGFSYYMCGLCGQFPLVMYPESNGPAHVTCEKCHPGRTFLPAHWNYLNQQARDRMVYAAKLEKELNTCYDRFHTMHRLCGDALRG